jgi:hypothetical protein
MTDFGKWVKTATDLRVAVGFVILAVTAIFSLGAATMSLVNNTTQLPKRMDRFEAVQHTVVERLDNIEPGLAYLYCVAKAEAEGVEVGPFTCGNGGD